MYTPYKTLQRNLRKQMPAPEVVLWQKLRNSQLGIKFRRQYALEKRILDFYAPAIKLGIELDGDSHYTSLEKHESDLFSDRQFLQKYGITVLRFLNHEVMHNLEGVIMKISEHTTRT